MRHIVHHCDTDSQQVELFPFAGLLPHRAQFREDKGAAPVIRRCTPKALRRYPYIRVNPPNLAMWLGFDIDRDGALMAWEEAGLPPPAVGASNYLAGHTAPGERPNTRGHLLYPLSAPVLVGDAARGGPLRYLAAIECAFRVRLGGDPQFSLSSHSTKNPWYAGSKHLPAWRTFWGPERVWDLGDLAEWVDLPRHLPKRGVRAENVGYGRNCILFDRLRLWAQHAVRRIWASGGGAQDWQVMVQGKAAEMNGDFGCVGGDWVSFSGPLGDLEVYHVAKHVAKFIWAKFSPQRFAEIQRARWAKAEAKITNQGLESWAQNTPKNGR